MARTVERTSEGESFTVTYKSNSYLSAPTIEAIKVDGDAGGAIKFATAPIVNGVTSLVITGIKQTTIAGTDASGSAQSITLAGVKVGDRVVGVVDMVGGTVGGDLSADFETTISVAGHISQLNTNLSAVTKILVTVLTLS